MVINILYTPGEKIFKLNGKTYVRNFHAYVAGDKIRIVNAYDTRDELLPYTKFDLISFNGNSYNSALEVMAAIAQPLFRKLGDSSGGLSVPFDNNITVLEKSVYINWSASGSRDGKVAQKLSNSAPFTVNGNQFVLIYTYKNFTMYQAQNYNPEIHLWIFKPGKGTYGYNETPVQVKDIRYIGYTRGNYENVEYDLGEIGELPISLYINQDNVSYTTNQDVYNIFKCTREGNDFSYVFIGTDKYLIGNYQNNTESQEVFESEFNLLTGETLYPPTQISEANFYDTYQVTDPATLAVADFSAGANFYFIEEINTELMHFAVKQTQKDAAAFDGARVHIDGNNYDIENPTSQNGYDIYLLGSADDIGTPNGNNLPFNVWSFGGGGAAELSETVISTGGSKHNFNLDGNNVVVFNTSSNSTLTGLESGKIKEVIIINKGTGAVDVPSNSSNSASSNRFQFAVSVIKIPQNGVLRVYFSEIDNVWKVANLEGIPTNLAHLGLTEDQVLVIGPDGITRTEEAKDIFIANDVRTTLYTTDAELNTDYSDAFRGVRVQCSQTLQVCEKLDNSSTGKWLKGFVDRYETQWVNVTTTADVNSSTVKYRRIGNTIQVQGIIETNNISPQADVVCFTLPLGFRPVANVATSIPVSFNTGNYEPHFCSLSINGVFTINNCSGVAATVIYLEFTI